MRHKLKGRKLGRTSEHRTALGKNLVSSLFTYGRIFTTVEKAKEFRSLAEKLITKAKKGGLDNYRFAISILQNREIVRKLFRDIAPRFVDRPGGYTRVIRLGGSRWDGEGKGKYASNRLGDNGRRAIFELVVKKSPNEEVALAKGKEVKEESIKKVNSLRKK